MAQKPSGKFFKSSIKSKLLLQKLFYWKLPNSLTQRTKWDQKKFLILGTLIFSVHCVQINLFASHENWGAKLLPNHDWMRHSFHQNFFTNLLVLSNPVLFAFRDCDLTNTLLNSQEFFYISAKNQEKYDYFLNCSP